MAFLFQYFFQTDASLVLFVRLYCINAAETSVSAAFLIFCCFINLMTLPFNGWFALPLEGDNTGVPPAAGGIE